MRTNMNKCKQLSIIVGFLMLLGTANMSAEGPRTRQKESKEAQKAFASANCLQTKILNMTLPKMETAYG